MDQQNKELIQLRKNYRITFDSEEGKKVLNDLEKRCHEFVTTFSKDSSTETAFLEGQRSILIFLKAMIKPHKE
jgi:hypothetical protein|tara:strand:+ start:189 stop:407 length:219 start_codon:yes stop_codon:yes gene_type:complete